MNKLKRLMTDPDLSFPIPYTATLEEGREIIRREVTSAGGNAADIERSIAAFETAYVRRQAGAA